MSRVMHFRRREGVGLAPLVDVVACGRELLFPSSAGVSEGSTVLPWHVSCGACLEAMTDAEFADRRSELALAPSSDPVPVPADPEVPTPTRRTAAEEHAHTLCLAHEPIDGTFNLVCAECHKWLVDMGEAVSPEQVAEAADRLRAAVSSPPADPVEMHDAIVDFIAADDERCENEDEEPGEAWNRAYLGLRAIAERPRPAGLLVVSSPEREAVTGAELIEVERRRQVEAEGWTPEHDDKHKLTELLGAAVEYVQHAQGQIAPLFHLPDTGECWPWDMSWWKPSDDPVRNLVKAGALIAAEIDRLQRVKAVASLLGPSGGAS